MKPRAEEKKSAAAAAPAAPTPERKVSETAAGRRYHDIEISSIRRSIAKRLTFSKTNIPHQYISVTSNVDQVLKLRKQMISDPKATVKVSVNDFIIKAVACALRVRIGACFRLRVHLFISTLPINLILISFPTFPLHA